MNLDAHTPLKDELLTFLRRPYGDDAERLNRSISKNGTSASFENQYPPIPFTGNPFTLTPGQCVTFVGLNPRAPQARNKNLMADCHRLTELVEGIRLGNSAVLQDYLEWRGSYFDEKSTAYYGRYFTAAGRIIGTLMKNDTPAPSRRSQFAKRIFRTRALKIDVLPWMSHNTDGIDWRRVAKSDDEALDAYWHLVRRFIIALQPRWIQCHGVESMPALERMFGVHSALRNTPIVLKKDGKMVRRTFAEGKAMVGGNSIPIFVHPFSNRINKEYVRELKERTAEICQEPWPEIGTSIGTPLKP